MNTVQKLFLVSIFGLFICACQSNKPVPNNTPYSLAVDSKSGLQRTKYVPVPMPGQLMSLKHTKSPNRLVGEAAIEAANKKAIQQPNSGEYINSIMTFDYMPGALYQIYAAPLSVTDIQFQNNEHIVAVGAGDTVRWQVSKTYSGMGASRQEHLLIKPVDEGLTNGLVVTTDQRTYHMMLHSTPKTYMASVTWHYPDTDDLVTKFEDSPDSITDITNGVDLNRLNFNYEAKLVKGPVPDWYPKMVFNDGKKTYIKFSSQTQESPSLFIGNAKNSRVASYRVQGNYYIVTFNSN
ncbi:MAG: TrbG/VirB9 family P-type conjugative transfer protein [Gammaproteobacteria bacterium]|nr:TrbG/VirB9 family P-type conjugative transfer protein [Gammaproteobacteria bacterium]